tara:strand:- start:5226 stop:5978 length:753 start_codon:yes stop_codon:yes gene_type:complete
MALTQQGMFGNQNLSPFLQDFVNRTGANFGSSMQPVVQPPVLYQGALGLFNRVGPDYCQLNPNDVNCKPTSGEGLPEDPKETPTTAQLIDQYNIITNPITKGLAFGIGTLTGLPLSEMLFGGTYIAEENITDNLTKGGPSTGGLTDRFGRAITDKDQIPNKEGLFSFGKDFEKALALSLDPFGGGYSINEFEDYGGLDSQGFNQAVSDFQTQVATANLEIGDPEMDEDDNTGSMGPGEEGPGQDALGGIT